MINTNKKNVVILGYFIMGGIMGHIILYNIYKNIKSKNTPKNYSNYRCRKEKKIRIKKESEEKICKKMRKSSEEKSMETFKTLMKANTIPKKHKSNTFVKFSTQTTEIVTPQLIFPVDPDPVIKPSLPVFQNNEILKLLENIYEKKDDTFSCDTSSDKNDDNNTRLEKNDAIDNPILIMACSNNTV